MKAHNKSAQTEVSPFMQDERLATIDALMHRSGLSDDQRHRLEQLHGMISEEARIGGLAPEKARRLDTRIRWIERGAPVQPLSIG